MTSDLNQPIQKDQVIMIHLAILVILNLNVKREMYPPKNYVKNPITPGETLTVME